MTAVAIRENKPTAYSEAGLVSLILSKTNGKTATLPDLIQSFKTIDTSLKADISRAIEHTQRPALPINGRDPIKASLAYTEAMTARPTEGSDDIKFKVQVYASELRKHPGDLVIDVCQHWNRYSKNKWFPALVEIEEVIVNQNAWRTMVLKHLQEE